MGVAAGGRDDVGLALGRAGAVCVGCGVVRGGVVSTRGALWGGTAAAGRSCAGGGAVGTAVGTALGEGRGGLMLNRSGITPGSVVIVGRTGAGDGVGEGVTCCAYATFAKASEDNRTGKDLPKVTPYA